MSCFAVAAIVSEPVYAAIPNSRYSLSGAKYQLFTDSACTQAAKDTSGKKAILTTDENGDSNILEMAPGTYYAKETRASRGYRLDTDKNGKAKVYKIRVTADDTDSDPATFTSEEPPCFGIPEFMVVKTEPTGSFDYTSLLGAKFTVKYYDVESKADIADAEPKDQWTFETVKKDRGDAPGGYTAGFDWQEDDPVSYMHEGESVFYEAAENGETKRVLPLGWFTIEETEAPPGFKMTDKVCYGHVYQPENGAKAVTEIEDASKDSKQDKTVLNFENEPKPEINTDASLENGNSELRDRIAYKGLLPGRNYVFKGWLVDTVTGEKIEGSDGSSALKADAGTGETEVVMKTEKYDGMAGYSMTAFEELYIIEDAEGQSKEILVAEHKDLNNKAQTEEIFQDLKIKKNVTGNLGDLTKVFEYTADFTGLVPGQSYTVEGDDEKVFNADPEGNASIPLKLMDDQSVIIRKLPKGAKYQVTEAASDHVASYRLFSEDMAEKGAKINSESGSNGSETDKDLSTALEMVDTVDGTVVILWENNRDLATLTAVQSYLGIWACAAAMVLAGILAILIRNRKYRNETEG